MAFVIAEAVAGWYGNSLALLADAGHNPGDVLSLLLAWGSRYLTQRTATTRRTYGLRRSSILAALTNAIFLRLAVGAIGWEALTRLTEPYSSNGRVVIAVAVIGVVINGAQPCCLCAADMMI
jgi:cobalt-zinc-cadmium efflux system protein